MPFTLPCLSSDGFCSVIPMAWAGSLDLAAQGEHDVSLISMGMADLRRTGGFLGEQGGLAPGCA